MLKGFKDKVLRCARWLAVGNAESTFRRAVAGLLVGAAGIWLQRELDVQLVDDALMILDTAGLAAWSPKSPS